MRKLIFITLLTLSMTATTALADSINNRLGVSGRIGFTYPIKDSTINGTTFETDAAFVGGGGLIFGFCNNFAVEVDVSRTTDMDTKIGGVTVAKAGITDIGLGLQYRFFPNNRLVPYIGVGADFIKGDIDATTLNWTYGGHVNAGLDYFITKGIAATADFRYMIADKSTIEKNNVEVGKFDPMNFTGLFGVRLFLPENWM